MKKISILVALIAGFHFAQSECFIPTCEENLIKVMKEAISIREKMQPIIDGSKAADEMSIADQAKLAGNAAKIALVMAQVKLTCDPETIATVAGAFALMVDESKLSRK